MEREKKQSSAVSDIGAWALNVVSSVGLIMANKQLMSPAGYAFVFATTLTGFHFCMTGIIGLVSKASGYTTQKKVPLWELLWFSIVANTSITGMNLSLMLNSVGFYQISKLSMIPVVCVMEWILHGKQYSSKSIGSLQKKYAIGSFELLSQTAPIQAVSLLLLGPFVDYFLTGNLLPTYHLSSAAFPISLHRTVLRGLVPGFRPHENGFLILGWLLFDSELTFKNILGMAIAVLGMLLYSWAIEADKATSLPKHGSDHVKLLLKEHEVDGSSPVKDVELGVGGLSRG
ncbi:hypothetical protein GOBAR_AA35801 [Gossypium barbadense]|uniref:Sugar phosphate transporter domain-containing protein n=1 Tax=Gossypium barbadense TaxID=3634 RepID=A0A2P5W1D7_GOSBA|nr:hypothetical protein GOBAR_AA35801 [Gossypium barbadense]